MTTEYAENDAIPAGVPTQGHKDPDGNECRGRWITDTSNKGKPQAIMVERFVETKPEVSEWDIWIEAKEGIGEAEKLNPKPIKAPTFFEAASEYMWKDKQLARPVGPNGKKARNLLHKQGGNWYMRSWDHPKDEMGRRLWPTEDQARGLTIWNVWVEGQAVGEEREPASKVNGPHIVADSFDKAVQKYIATLGPVEASNFAKDEERNVWTYQGRKLYPTEGRARVTFG